ncbi:MAG: hypothetical protein RQ866_00925 [Bacteroidales bacterium]|nr:hypothetical protein [Bacteroidales bacterium]
MKRAFYFLFAALTISVLMLSACKEAKRIEKSIDNGGPDVSKPFYLQFKSNADIWFTFETDDPDITGMGTDYIYNTWTISGDNAIIKIQEDHTLNASNIKDLKGKSYQVGGLPSAPVKADIILYLTGDGNYNTWDATQTTSDMKIDNVISDGKVDGKNSFIVKGHFNCTVLDVSAGKQMVLTDGVFSLRFVEQ